MKLTTAELAKATGERAAKVLVPAPVSPTEPEFMTAAEVAELFRVTRQCVTRLARKGKLPAIRLGATWRFNRAEIKRLGRLESGEG